MRAETAPLNETIRFPGRPLLGTVTTIAIALFAASTALAERYHVGPDGHDDSDGINRPWLTLQHAVDSLPAGNHIIQLSPGTYSQETSLRFSKTPLGSIAIHSADPRDPGIITCTGDQPVISVSSGFDKGSLSFRDVSITHSKTSCLVQVAVENLRLSFDHCSLTSTGVIVETAAGSSGVWIEFQSSNVRAASKALNVQSAASIVLKGCQLAWDDGPFMHGRAKALTFDGCSFDGSPTTLLLKGGVAGEYTDLFQVSRCTGSCGRVSWEQGAIRRLRVVANNIRWKHTGTVTIGAGIEVRNAQAAPVVNPAPYAEIIIAHNTFQFAEGATHPIFLGKGADNARVVDNVLISPKGRKYGIVVKSDHNVFEFNSIYGGTYAFYLAGGSNNQVRHNTIVAFQGSAFVIDAHQERSVPPAGTYGQPRDNVIVDNIFVSSGGPAFGHDTVGDDRSSSWNTHSDRNVYWNTAEATVACLNGVSVPRTNGIAGVRAQWSSYGDTGSMRTNDAGSVVADPQLSNPPADFSLKSGSPARHLDKASRMNAGVWQEGGGAVSAAGVWAETVPVACAGGGRFDSCPCGKTQ